MAKKVKKEGKTPTKRKSKASDTGLSAEAQQELATALESTRPVPYKMGNIYQSKMVIEHPKFGLGVVTRSFDTKIDVNFSDGARALVHNRR